MNSAFHVLWLANLEVISKYYSPPSSRHERFSNFWLLVTNCNVNQCDHVWQKMWCLSIKVRAPNPQFFFCWNESAYYSKHLGEKKFEFGWILDFPCPFKVAVEVFHDCVLGSLGAMVADDVYPGTKRNGTSVSSLYLLEKMENKTNHSNLFWD